MFAHIINDKIDFLAADSQPKYPWVVIEYDGNKISNPFYTDGKIISQKSDNQIRTEKLRELVTAEDYTIVDITGITLTDTEKGDIIMARLFKDEVTGMPNPHAQMALTVKATQAQMRMMAWQPKPGDTILLQYTWEKEAAINALRAFFNYSDTL